MATARNLKLIPDPEPRVLQLEEIQQETVKEDNHFDALMTSIQTLGILQPPVLREPKSKTAKYEVIAGHRRIEACRQLGIEKIICVVYPKTVDKAFIPSAMIAENQVRSKNIGSDIIAMGLLIDQGFDDPETVSNLTGMSLSEVKKLLELRSLPAPVLDGIVGGVIATTTAHEVKKLRPKAMEKALGVLEETGKLTANDIRRVREVQIDHAASQIVLPDIPDLPELEDDDVITAKGDTLGVVDQIIRILESDLITNDEKIAAIRSLLGLGDASHPARVPTPTETEAHDVTPTAGLTIAQRATRSRRVA